MILAFALFVATQALEPASLVRVDLIRDTPACRGEAHYTTKPTDVDLAAEFGTRGYVVDVEVPCARLDAVDALLPLPDTRGGKLSVRTEVVSIRQGELLPVACVADLQRRVIAVNSDVAAAVGQKLLHQRIDPVSCTRLSQALTGAQITNKRDWPEAQIALPLPVKP